MKNKIKKLVTKSWLYDYILVFYRRKVFCLFLIVNINFMNFFRWYSICSSLGLSQMSKLLTKTMVSQYIQQTRPSSGDWAFWRRTANWRYLYFFVTLTKLELNYIFYKLSIPPYNNLHNSILITTLSTLNVLHMSL